VCVYYCRTVRPFDPFLTKWRVRAVLQGDAGWRASERHELASHGRGVGLRGGRRRASVGAARCCCVRAPHRVPLAHAGEEPPAWLDACCLLQLVLTERVHRPAPRFGAWTVLVACCSARRVPCEHSRGVSGAGSELSRRHRRALVSGCARARGPGAPAREHASTRAWR
jgi:hypothetical protein